jgi:hypothetical protein
VRSGEEIRAALVRFAARWRDYAGGESEANTFVDELFACYGVDRRDRGAIFQDRSPSGGIMDVHLPGDAIIEMKAPREAARLIRHRPQAWDYWYGSADLASARPAPRFVVLCAFHRFEIWEPGRYPSEPVLSLSLDELPDQYDALMFLAGEEPLFRPARRRMTEQAAAALAGVYRDLLARQPRSRANVQRFVLCALWKLFAEQELTEVFLREAAKGSARVLSTQWMYADQEIDADLGWPGGAGEPMLLTPDVAGRLRDIAGYDWPAINPTIFGSLVEGFLGAQDRAALGAHYTHEVDILRIVRPTIVRPWQQRIGAVGSVPEGMAVLGELCGFRVLDPACGCGNFLYVAYRELRTLAAELKHRIDELAAGSAPAVAGDRPHIPLRNMHGFDREVVAAGLARTTLRIGLWQMDRGSGAAVPAWRVPLPTIQAKDALAEPWPVVDCIVGNPPFLGSQHIRRELGADYKRWLGKEFGIGVKDYCVYWFRRAHDHLAPGQRAGFVATNSITQNRARPVSLEYIVDNNGVVTDAVSSQHWPGSAAVDVSLVNWVKSPSPAPTAFVLDGVVVPGITADLRTPETSTADARPLGANHGRCFQGMSPVGEGFILSADQAAALLARTDADYREVVRPYLIGEDIAESPRQAPGRWVVDFGRRPLEAAMAYPAALAVVRERVKPLRDGNADRFRREHWWLFGRPYAALRSALGALPRYLAAGRVGKRLLFAWYEPSTCPSDLVHVFAFPDDYSMGVLSSSVHEAWARARSSTLTDRLRYTPTSAFMPFPWPCPLDAEAAALVARAGRRMLTRRQEICLSEGIGLTKLYNRLDDGAYADLKQSQRELDAAVAACYGWPRKVARDPAEITRRLRRLNHEIASGARPYHPFPASPCGPGAQQFSLDFAGEPAAA